MKKLINTTLILFFILLINSTKLFAYEKIKYDLFTQLSVTPGMYFDRLEDLNKYLLSKSYPEISPEHVYFIGFNYTGNHLPFLFFEYPNLACSLDFRIPFARQIEQDKKISLNTYSFFFEMLFFHDLINNITIYPVVGLGASWTNLNIASNINTNTLNDNINVSKFNGLINLGGGMDYRVVMQEDYTKRTCFVIGLCVRYSLSMDDFGIYNKYWKQGGEPINDMPDYHAPALSIELKLSYEILQKVIRNN